MRRRWGIRGICACVGRLWYAFGTVRAQFLLASFLVLGSPGFGQTATAPPQALPKDPRAIFAAAAPFYDFNDPKLKPWHLKAAYQLYDENGKPTVQGTFEYWWASPKVHRSTWTRPGMSRTDWHTADGKHAFLGSGERLTFFEGQLQNDLLGPLPSPDRTDPGKVRLVRHELKLGTLKLPCVSLVKNNEPQKENLRYYPTYCFDASLPVLLLDVSFTGVVVTAYEQIAKFQGRFLARDIKVYAGDHTFFTATVDTIGMLNLSDPALVPPGDAISKPEGVSISDDVMDGRLVKKEMPVYPPLARQERKQGTVLIDAKISVDGSIEDARVICSPSALLSASSLQAVSRWQYKPYTINGTPVETDTLISVIFQLSP